MYLCELCYGTASILSIKGVYSSLQIGNILYVKGIKGPSGVITSQDIRNKVGKSPSWILQYDVAGLPVYRISRYGVLAVTVYRNSRLIRIAKRLYLVVWGFGCVSLQTECNTCFWFSSIILWILIFFHNLIMLAWKRMIQRIFWYQKLKMAQMSRYGFLAGNPRYDVAREAVYTCIHSYVC